MAQIARTDLPPDVSTAAEKLTSLRDNILETKIGVGYLLVAQTARHRWAIVIGFYEDELRCKLAYQTLNSIMQCDYDVDWLMPYNIDTGDVYDNEETIFADTDMKQLAERYLKLLQDYKKGGILV